MALTPAQQQDVNNAFSVALRFHQQGDLVQAESIYQKIIAIDPRHADALHLLGVIAQQLGDPDTACKLIKRAIRIKPKAAQYHYNLGVAHQALDDWKQSIRAYQECLKHQPDYLQALENLSIVYLDADNPDAALNACKKALMISDRSLIAHHNLGRILFEKGVHREAIDHLDHALDLNPAHAESHWLKSAALLSLGNYVEGWQEYEWRLHVKDYTDSNPSRVVPFPKWGGEPLEGSAILITAEQGIGDEFLFASCYADVIASAKHCTIECDSRVQSLFSRSFPQARFIPRDQQQAMDWHHPMPKFDYRIGAGSLPRFLRQDRQDFSTRDGYIQSDRVRQREWQERLQQLDGQVNIGIAWQGGSVEKFRQARSIPLDHWRSLLGHANVNFINIQYGDHRKAVASFNKKYHLRLHHFDDLDALNDLEGYCALLSQLDLIISIDNSTVHMAGALGVPAWVLLPHNPIWIWQTRREDSDWYASVRLFRQSAPGLNAWKKLLETVNQHLLNHLQCPKPRQPHRITDDEPTPQNTWHNSQTVKLSGLSALLVNDTQSWYHWGCSCTSLAIHGHLRDRFSQVGCVPISQLSRLQQLPDSADQFDDDDVFDQFCSGDRDLLQKLERADQIYINGEGSLHGIRPISLTLLYLAYVAKQRLGKIVHIINHSCYPEGTLSFSDSPAYHLYKKVYQSIDGITIREPASLNLLRQMGLPVQLGFDCLPLYLDLYYRPINTDTTHPVLIAGSVAWSQTETQVVGDLIRQLADRGFKVRFLIGADAFIASDDVKTAADLKQVCGPALEIRYATSENDWLTQIANSRLLISGRFHHTIAAAFLDTPFLVMDSNTPKIDGLMKMLELDTRLHPRAPTFSDQLISTTEQLLENPNRYLLDANVKDDLRKLAMQNFAF